MTSDPNKKEFSYFPGCSLATTARENNQSLVRVCAKLGFKLVELEDWNCCGSSSTHSIHSDLALHFACRNLSLAAVGRPLLIACPSCLMRLKQAQLYLMEHPEAHDLYEAMWGRPFDPGLEIVHFFELLSNTSGTASGSESQSALKGLRFVPYYGCMLNRPAAMRFEKDYHGLMESILSSFGATPVSWSHLSKCCGTFLSVAKPAVVTPMVNRIIQGALDVKADCLVTACSMCHLNLEIRCTLKNQLPAFHFSELLSLALGIGIKKTWLTRHLVDPMPLLKAKGLM
jgi:heterodisulfide reductase subunit B2